jgi:hypothetical protein
MRATNKVWINETMFSKEQVEVFYSVLPEYEEETAVHDALITKRYGSINVDVSPLTSIVTCILVVIGCVKMYL